jgi:Holliday junction resolvasome RuvABC ATP-dependent DNA helicase subunit
MIEEDSLVSGQIQENEEVIMTSVRPKLLSEYIGQVVCFTVVCPNPSATVKVN